MADLKGCFSSNSDEWATPQSLFDELDREFHFDLDPCSTHENHKCEKYYTLENDGISQNWGGVECFAIHLIHRLISGLRKHLERLEMTTHLLFY